MMKKLKVLIMSYLIRWGHAWITLADGLASVLALGLWWPNWSFKYIAWAERRRLYARLDERVG